MKKNIPLLIFIFTMTFSGVQLICAAGIGPGNQMRTSTIDFQDTVVFDMSRATTIANTVLIPVQIHSDDTIVSLDFSFQYNHANLSYDSVPNLTNYIIAFSYYNSVDSTVRFTSNSTQEYGHDSDLVAVQFAMLTNHLYNSDMFNLTAYLNGDPCSVKVIGGLTTSIDKPEKEEIGLFPNPVTDVVHIYCGNKSVVRVLNLDGIELQLPVQKSANGIDVDMSDVAAGNYLLIISDNNNSVSRRIIKK